MKELLETTERDSVRFERKVRVVLSRGNEVCVPSKHSSKIKSLALIRQMTDNSCEVLFEFSIEILGENCKIFKGMFI